jgi:spermidine synthase
VAEDVPSGRPLRLVVLVAVFVCAACGLVYELALVTLGSYLLGSSVTQTSLVIAVSMSAMGVGAVAAKPLLHRPLPAFVGVELALALIGGFSVPALYAAFAWLHLYTPAMLVSAFAVGALVGAEIPLLMALLQRLRRQEAAHAVADLNAVDYLGALVGGLAFPFLLLPLWGLLEGTLVTAALNVVAAWVVALGFSRRARSRTRAVQVTVLCATVALALGLMAVRAADFEASAQQALYRDPIVHSERSAYQSIVVTRGAAVGGEYDDVRLFLDGDLQFSSVDEYRYHEMLVHPALGGPRERVLVLGGGDGLALREVLRTPGVEEVTLVDLDPAVVDLSRDLPAIRELHGGVWQDPRVTYAPADAFTWVREQLDAGGAGTWDAVIADFPDPDSAALAKLYTLELYRMLRGLLASDGRLVVQAGSPFFAPLAFWSIERTLAAAGLATVPYHTDVPSFGDWGFVLAGRRQPRLELAEDAPPMRYATPEVLAAASVFPPDRERREVDVSTLLDPAIVDYARQGWVGY